MGAPGNHGRRVAFKTLGCKVNQVESEAVAEALLGSGWTLAAASSADVVVVNSCTVTAEADRKVRKAVRHALGEPSRPLVVVTGCLATLDPEGLRELGDRVVVARREEVAARVQALVGAEAEALDAATAPVRALGRTRAMLKVEDGCDCFCTYCIVPHARGVPRSVSLQEVLTRVGEHVDGGAKEIVLTGINLGKYRHGDTGLPDLLREVARLPIPRVRLSSIEPLDLTPAVLGALAGMPNLCPHLHVPLQSGSDSVLEAMGRGYDSQAFSEVVEAAREALPGLALTTDVMAGFPGETDQDAEDTRVFVERAGFSKLHVFRYSRRPGTPAAEMPDQVAEEVKAERSSALRVLGDRLRKRYERSRLRARAEVLVERVAGGVAEGTSEDYLKVRMHTRAAREGDIVRCVITAAEEGFVAGEPA